MQNSFLVFALSKMKIQNKRSCLKQTNDLFYVSFGGEGGLEEWLVTNFWFSAFVYSFFFFYFILQQIIAPRLSPFCQV